MLKRLIKAYKGRSPTREVPGWPKARGFDIFLPPKPKERVPLIVVFHGYTQDGSLMRALTSATGDLEDPAIFDRAANHRGYGVVYPYGTKIGFLPGRCWNAGGRVNGFAPVGDPAVRLNVPDVDFFQDLLATIESNHPVDASKVFLVGISNGGAMVQRLAVELPARLQAVATVAGCNQYSAATHHTPPEPVALLHIHGTQDKVWPYAGGKFGTAGVMESVERSVQGWIQANQAEPTEERALDPVYPDDPVRVHLKRYQGLKPVECYRLDGGGHSWPGGHQFMSEKVIGKVSRQLSANDVILDFFDRRRA